jgi:DedD protein
MASNSANGSLPSGERSKSRKRSKSSASESTPMDERTRYRVTGSLFLLAIAVILFPMLFDGAGLEPLRIEPLDVPQNVPEVPSRESMAPASDFVARADELRDSVAEGGFQLDAEGTRMGEPVLTEPDETTRVWAVQVASFGEEANALTLRDKLRSDDKAAFISTVRQNDEILRRVAVGPLLDKAEADSLRDELARTLELSDVRVVAFSN